MTEPRPNRLRLLAYVAIGATFEGLLAYCARKRCQDPLVRLGWDDLVLFGLATHKVTNLIAEERVTRVLRQPFVEDQPAAEGGEVERPAPGPLRGALGQLVTCPYCLGPWTALAFATGHMLQPRATRLASEIFAIVALADFLHHGSALLKAKTTEARQLHPAEVGAEA